MCTHPYMSSRIVGIRDSKRSMLRRKCRKNQQLSSERVLNENVIGSLKRLKIIADRYRNRRKRFALRVNLICGNLQFGARK